MGSQGYPPCAVRLRMPIANALAPGALLRTLRWKLTALSEPLAALIILYGSCSRLCFAFFLHQCRPCCQRDLSALYHVVHGYTVTLRYNESKTMTHSVHPLSKERHCTLPPQFLTYSKQGRNQTSKNEEAPSDRAPQVRVKAPRGMRYGERVSLYGERVFLSPLPRKNCPFLVSKQRFLVHSGLLFLQFSGPFCI